MNISREPGLADGEGESGMGGSIPAGVLPTRTVSTVVAEDEALAGGGAERAYARVAT
jgi:hypothetical protein